MIKVIIKNRNANDILEIVRELREQGLVQGTDFDFAYNKAQYDNFSYEPAVEQHTVFSFHTEKYATLFALRYS
jgi:hypothetical protein